MALSYVTLTLDLFDGQGSHLNGGTATFTPSVQLTDATDGEIVTQAPVTAAFKSTGSPVVSLLATDNAAVTPAGWAWTVTFSGVSGSPAAFSFLLPYSGGAAQSLSALSPVSAAVTQFPANPMTAAGDVIYGGASPAGTPERLGIGAANDVLTVDSVSGLPAWRSASAASLPLTTLGDTLYEDATPGPARLPGNVTSTKNFLTQTGTGSASAAPAWGAIQAADVPVLNQDTAGNAATATAAAGLQSATTTVAVSSAAAPASGQVLTATSGTAATWQAPATGFANPMTATGDIIVEDATPAPARLAGPTSATKQFLTSAGTGTAANVPAWGAIAAPDVPVLNQDTTGTAANITATLDLVPAPAADVSLNSRKITSLANGSAAQDAAAFGQVPLFDAAAAHIQPAGTQAAGANARIADSGHVHPADAFTALDCGFLAWNYDIAVISGATAPAAGAVSLIRVNARSAISVTNVIIGINAAGSGLTAGQNFAGLYDSSGTLIGTTADQSAAWASAGLITMALTGGPFAVAAGAFVWVAVMSNGTTRPALVRGSSPAAPALDNAGFAAATARWAVNGTGTTALPASVTPASNVLASPTYWAALS